MAFVPVVHHDDEKDGNPDPEGRPAKTQGGWKTPLLVGVIAGGILGIAFLAAIVRGGGTPPSPGPPGSPSAGAPGGAAAPRVIQGKEGTPVLLSPIGHVPHGALTLTWRPVPGIEEYEASLYDSQARRLWRSGRVTDDHVELSAIALSSLQQGPAYFWNVVGYGPDGREAKSPDAQFYLTP